MPRGSNYQGPADKLEHYVAVVEGSESGAEMKGAKNPYTSRNGHMFSFLDGDGTMALRLSDELTEEFRSHYDSGDVTQYGATMRGYSSVPAELLEATAELVGWFDKAWTWIGTLPPKPTKK
jgi:hypothetical protein